MFRTGTLGKKMFLIMMVTMILIVMLFGSVSFYTLLQTVNTSSQAMLETSLVQLERDLENDYQSMLYLSQQMTAQGTVGLVFNEYLNAVDLYELGVIKRRLIRVKSTYAGLNTELVMYYNDETATQVFGNFQPDKDFAQKERLHVLYSNPTLSYYAIHNSYSSITDRPVVSLIRETEFDDEVQYTIYIEQSSSIPETIEEISAAQDIGYIFLQMDASGTVQYSTDTLSFPVGSQPEWLKGSFGSGNGYIFALTEATFGAKFALLAPKSAYNTDIANWMKRSAVVLVLMALIVFASASIAYRYIFTGLLAFSREIDRSIHGSLEPSREITHIKELDQLLRHFDVLKQHIKQMMAAETARERKRRKSEIEALTYQINPHFLFNTLNSIHWLAAMNGQKPIARYISNLNTILSYNLGRTAERPTLRSEINILQLYLEIEQSRHDFNVSLSIEEGEYLGMETPRLILQPIVENAIGHGIDDQGMLSVSIRPIPGEGIVTITVADDGCGIPPDTLRRLNDDDASARGIGLRYVKTMVTAMYGDAASFRIESEIGKGTRVTLTLPLAGEGNGK